MSPTNVEWGIFRSEGGFDEVADGECSKEGGEACISAGVSLSLGRECDIVLSVISSAPGLAIESCRYVYGWLNEYCNRREDMGLTCTAIPQRVP